MTFGGLRVILFKDRGVWVARGLEMDITTQGPTSEKVKGNFLECYQVYCESVECRHVPLEKWAIPAPPEIWARLYRGFFKKTIIKAPYPRELFESIVFHTVR